MVLDIKRLRKDLKINQIDFAVKLGFTQSYISQLENGAKASDKFISSLECTFNFDTEKYTISTLFATRFDCENEVLKLYKHLHELSDRVRDLEMGASAKDD